MLSAVKNRIFSPVKTTRLRTPGSLTSLAALALAAFVFLPAVPLRAEAEDDARKAKPVTEAEAKAAEAARVQATAAGTFGTKKRTISKAGIITEHSTDQKIKVKFKDHGDAGARQDEVDKQQLVEKIKQAQVKSEASKTAVADADAALPRKEGAPTPAPVPAAAQRADGDVKIAKAVPVEKEQEGASVGSVQQGNETKRVKLTLEQERLLKEQLRAKKASEEQLRQQRKILDKTPETNDLKNPTLKKRGSFTR